MNEKKHFIDLISNDNLLKIKFTLIKIGTGNKTVAVDNDWPNGATETDLGDRETVPWHQGAAVVPDSGVATHEEIRPETHD